jgi:phosphoribosylglycinamide formyltransferase-1
VRWAVLVGGRGSNLEALIRSGIDIVQVVSHRAGVGALAIAERAGIPGVALEPVHWPDRDRYDEAIAAQLEASGADGVVMAGFLRKIGPLLVDRYRDRIINIHPSLLPAFPGLHAIRQALRYGVKVTGATVHFVDEEIDHGPIIAQEAVAIYAGDTEESLTARVQAAEHRLLPEAVRALDLGRLRIDGRQVWGEAD